MKNKIFSRIGYRSKQFFSQCSKRLKWLHQTLPVAEDVRHDPTTDECTSDKDPEQKLSGLEHPDVAGLEGGLGSSNL